MTEIDFIDGRTTVRIHDPRLAAYLESVQAAGYAVRANKCRGKETFRDVLMIAKPGDLEEFFSEGTKIKEIYKQSPRIYRFLFDEREMILYLLEESDLHHSTRGDPDSG